jgi:hypothetical protein
MYICQVLRESNLAAEIRQDRSPIQHLQLVDHRNLDCLKPVDCRLDN